MNASGIRSPEKRVVISGDTTKKLNVKVQSSYADNVLVVGPRYQSEDMKCIWTTHLGMRVSGVCGINSAIMFTESTIHLKIIYLFIFDSHGT